MTKSKKTSKWNTLPAHVLLAAAYPSLALLAFNLNEVTSRVVFRPLWISLAFALGLLVLLRIVTRDWQRAGLIATLFLVLFFSYGHLYKLLEGIQIGNVFLFRHRTLLVVWALIGAWGGRTFWRKSLPLAAVTSTLNWVTLFLVIMPLGQIAVPTVGDAVEAARMSQPGMLRDVEAEAGPQSANEADVYYIILDAHGRADVLSQNAGYDSSAFLASLREMGFYVADCSQTNYSLTLLSLASSLNYSHLEDLMNEGGGVDFQSAISNSALRRFLEKRGYQTVAFATGFRMTELTNADHYYQPSSPKGSEFEAQLLDTTLWIAFVDAGLLPEIDMSAENYRDRTLLTLDTLKELP
ncbi:MAG TPA: hypothetical protein VLM78_01740, partial [Anaerolineales bacterium]|nr:hypothetical protein [Anaerolineales bacterium]